MTKKSRRVAKARRALFTLSLVLVMMVVAVGGTMAWLTDSTNTITNTFTATNLKIDLTEKPNAKSSESVTENDIWKAQIVPGVTLDKNPIVTVDRSVTNVPIYLFVEFDAGTSATYLDYTFTLAKDSEWTQGGQGTNDADVPNDVWYRVVNTEDVGDVYTAGENGTLIKTDATDCSWHLLLNDKVTVKSNIVKPTDETVPDGSIEMPSNDVTMSFTAYAIQQSGTDGNNFTPSTAWTALGVQ